MTIDEFEPEDALLEISRKLSNVSIHKLPSHGGTVEKDAVSNIAMERSYMCVCVQEPTA
jgi:hypothetical protein